MCGSALPRWLMLCLQQLVMLVFRTQGEVIAPSSMTAVAGLPFTLGCNVTIATGDTVKQVRWLNKHKQVLLAYEPGESVRTTSRQDDVELTSSHRNVSAITIKRAGPNDEGCYHCIFDIYPSGAQEGKTCLSIEVKVGNEGNKTAISGKLATMSCWYGLPDKVRQVLWRKTAEQGDTTTLASFAKRGQPSIEEPYRGRMTLNPSLGDTQLSIRPVKTEDEGCYTCEFHTYPEGTRSATACLFVYAQCCPTQRSPTWPPAGSSRPTAQPQPVLQPRWCGMWRGTTGRWGRPCPRPTTRGTAPPWSPAPSSSRRACPTTYPSNAWCTTEAWTHPCPSTSMLVRPSLLSSQYPVWQPCSCAVCVCASASASCAETIEI
ncbi:uncharacterized protein LOC115182130 isoform X4 [Salmo trutta]|uniref:uncharacterized protein LOC115182130 isoform X4 n=1 Tax=Salmo trutta TaxID=8032 RepID=UPI00113274F2|nr:uncharacterized protein LOC115182130 isoform X4 [Salmo trutta]